MAMEAPPEYSLFLGQILEELDTKRSMMTDQDVCKSLCARFDLDSLAKIRSLLFSTACLEPTFPATHFKDRMHSCVEDQHSNKLMVAADIVTIFNLIQMNEEIAKDKFPKVHKGKVLKQQSAELCKSNTAAYNSRDGRKINDDRLDSNPRDGHQHQHHHNHPKQQPGVQGDSPCSKLSESNSLQFHPTSDPNFLLCFNKDLKCKPPSLDQLHHLPQLFGSSQSSGVPEMQGTCLPTDTEYMDVPESLQHIDHPESFTPYSCFQKRNILKEEFDKPLAFSPQVPTNDCKQKRKTADSFHRGDLHKPVPYFNRSFELSYSNPYMEPAFNSPLKDRVRVKHESLDDLQASTYFGPTPGLTDVTKGKHINEVVKQPMWPLKSLSLNTEEGSSDFEISYLKNKQHKEKHVSNIGSIYADNEHNLSSLKEKVVNSPNFLKKSNGMKTSDLALVARHAAGLDKRGVAKKLREKNFNSGSCQGLDMSSSVGTQTEQPEPKKVRTYASKYNDRERPNLKHSDENVEIISDDISDIFRFLDDMSICDSLGVVQSSCQNSNGSLSQVTLKSESETSPEHGTVRLDKSKLNHLFHLQENTDDELKLSVCKLVMRIGEIEKKLETLSGVRSEISQVLSKLNKLDEKIQEPETNERQGEKTASMSSSTPDKSIPFPHPHSDCALSAYLFQCHTIGHNIRKEYVDSRELGQSNVGNSDSLRIKPLKRSLFTQRLSHSLNEENSATEFEFASITNSPRTLRTVSLSCHPGDTSQNTDECKNRHWKTKEAEPKQYYEVSQSPGRAVLLPELVKEPYLPDQVYSPQPFTLSSKAKRKGSLLYADLKLTRLPDGKSSRPYWTIQEHRCNPGEKKKTLTALGPQTQDSLNPNNLEYWMEDIYPPGYDSLLKRKEAEFRRSKVCKIGVLIAAATCTVILVIIVPICTMKS
ncbi:major intrinsically disordered Notch2-binding receptor 1 [Anableps anableps]